MAGSFDRPCRLLAGSRRAGPCHQVGIARRGCRHLQPAFGYRFIADELAAAGFRAGENRVARLCSQQQIWSVFAKKRGLARKTGPPVHDDLVRRQFTAAGPDQLWLTEVERHEALSNRVGVGDLHHRAVAAAWL
jgi:transposase InsO family protein